MTDIKTNLRDGAYVALGAAALGVAHLSKKRDSVKARFEPMIKDVTPRITSARGEISQRLSPLATRISPVAENVRDTVSTRVIPTAGSLAEKVSDNLAPVASRVVQEVVQRSQQALSSGRKIADEAKRRVS